MWVLDGPPDRLKMDFVTHIEKMQRRYFTQLPALKVSVIWKEVWLGELNSIIKNIDCFQFDQYQEDRLYQLAPDGQEDQDPYQLTHLMEATDGLYQKD